MAFRRPLVPLMPRLELLPFPFKIKWLPELPPLQTRRVLLVPPTLGLGDALQTLGFRVYLRLPPLQAFAMLLVEFPLVGRPLHRPGRRVLVRPHRPLPRPLPHRLPVKRIPRLVLYVVARPLLYLLLLSPRPPNLPRPTWYFVRPRLAPRFPLLHVHGHKFRHNPVP